MSFQIKLQINNSEKNAFTKSITDIVTLTGALRNESSIIDPTIIIEYDISNLTSCNYATIETFGRKYFVNNIKSIRNNLLELTLHCDVLSSFATQILSNTAIVYRQENQWNLYLNDGVFKTYQNPIVVTQQFPSGFTTNEFVLAVAGS